MAQKISKKFSLIGENIKKIRQAKKISQAGFAELFNLARPSVGAYEEGRSEPKIDTIIQIANYFSISIDVLLTRKLTISEIYSFDQLNRKLDQVHQTKPTGKKTGKEVTVVKSANFLEYIVNLNKKDYLNGLDKMMLPYNQSGTVRAFEINGSEMEYQQQGLHHGDLLIARKCKQDQAEELIGKVVIVVHKEKIIIRRLKELASAHLIAGSDDPNYPDQKIDVNDVLELWEASAVFSTYLEAPTRLEERILKIEEALKQLKR